MSLTSGSSVLTLLCSTWLFSLFGTAVKAANDTNPFMQLIEDHPEYVAIVGMGIVVLLLFIVTIVIICTMGSRRSPTKK